MAPLPFVDSIGPLYSVVPNSSILVSSTIKAALVKRSFSFPTRKTLFHENNEEVT